MKTPDRPGEGWAPPDPGPAPPSDIPSLSADPGPPPPHHPRVYGYPPLYGYPSLNGHLPQPYGQYADRQPPRPPVPVRKPWTVPAAPGTPFHRLARTPLHRWWRPLVGTLFILAVGLVVLLGVMLGAMIAVVLTGENLVANLENDRIFQNSTADLGLQLVSLAVLTPVVLLAAWLVQCRPPGLLSSVTGRLRGRWLLVCAGLAVVAFLFSYVTSWIAFAVTGTTEPGPARWAGWAAFLPPAVMIVLLVPFQAAAEEYIFRGWLLQAIASCTLETRTGPIARAASVILRTPWPAIVISAGAFTASHAYKGWALLDVFLFGVVAGWLAVRTGGLEAPIALHGMNNLVAFLIPAATGELSDALRVTDAPWQGVVSTVTQLGVFAGLVLLSARRRRLETVVPAYRHGQGPPSWPNCG